MRLDRLLANLGYGSRREVQGLMARGQVYMDGVMLRDPSAHVTPSADLPTRLSVSHQPIDPPSPLTILMHKPLGVVCSHKEAGRSVYELFPERWRRRTPALSSIGRLDAETTGLLLLTDNGALLHRIISPKKQTPKVYLATLARPLEGHESALFASGTLMLEGEAKPLAPAVLEALSDTTARLTITEGRYHQVRRMFAATGNHVEALHRDAIGDLAVPDDLAPGDWRVATAAEISAAGG